MLGRFIAAAVLFAGSLAVVHAIEDRSQGKETPHRFAVAIPAPAAATRRDAPQDAADHPETPETPDESSEEQPETVVVPITPADGDSNSFETSNASHSNVSKSGFEPADGTADVPRDNPLAPNFEAKLINFEHDVDGRLTRFGNDAAKLSKALLARCSQTDTRVTSIEKQVTLALAPKSSTAPDEHFEPTPDPISNNDEPPAGLIRPDAPPDPLQPINDVLRAKAKGRPRYGDAGANYCCQDCICQGKCQCGYQMQCWFSANLGVNFLVVEQTEGNAIGTRYYVRQGFRYAKAKRDDFNWLGDLEWFDLIRVQRELAASAFSGSSDAQLVIEAGRNFRHDGQIGVPSITTGRPDPVLQKYAEAGAQKAASLCLLGHHNWDRRFHEINSQTGGTPQEIAAESWPWQTREEAATEMFVSWRTSPGHWGAVMRRNVRYGYAMARGANNIWYGFGIVMDEPYARAYAAPLQNNVPMRSNCGPNGCGTMNYNSCGPGGCGTWRGRRGR